MPTDEDDIQPIRLALDETQKPTMEWLMENLPLGFRSDHCAEARTMLGWSIEALAFRSGVSPGAIRRLEKGAGLRRVTMQALAYALEAEGLFFLPGHQPMKGDNLRGATPCPRTRDDFHLIE
ncbi:helix-turn-helix domain-containing protein [Pseudomonas donghuensis]|nr:helix-turn-helix transcriptional regulator [Pseudomonas donghuensis]WKY30307.1 helix-turn-helix transcriptional regulator [Pseudomonas donghuensis]